MNKRKSRTGIAIVCIILLLLMMGAGIFVYFHFHWNVTLEPAKLVESAKEIENPNRGFYYIWGFRLRDEITDDDTAKVDRLTADEDHKLALIEVNLQEYADGAISDAGINNLDSLFAALAKRDKEYIVRFLYDWDGQNEQHEPQNLQIILQHINQVGPILRKYADHIFTLQGVFVGNWGEMNGSQYLDDDSLRTLAAQLASVSDQRTFLAVRTPMHWRRLMQSADPGAILQSETPYVSRLGLFNDGMLGNAGDYGTYGTQSRSQAGDYSEWSRDEELDFQDELCRTVPNGGEVIVDNEYNDLDNAISDFNRMHITYLNEDYDWNVIQKWIDSTVHTKDCFDGMDGFSYIKARLGYRFVLKESRMQQNFWKDTLNVSVDIQNVGFAPIYKECEARFIFYPKKEGSVYSVRAKQKLSSLVGGNETDQIATIEATIPLHKLSKTDYDVYFMLKDKASGKIIYFGNEEDCEADGYKIGQILQ